MLQITQGIGFYELPLRNYKSSTIVFKDDAKKLKIEGYLPEQRVHSFHVDRIWSWSVHSGDVSHNNISSKQSNEASSEEPCLN